MALSTCRRRGQRRGSSCCGAAFIATPLLAMASLLLALCTLPNPTAAAVSPYDAVARSPSAVPHLGVVVPLTIYVRMKRQIEHAFISVVDPQLAVDEEAVNNDVQGHHEAAATMEELRLKELDLPSLGATRGKHESQLVRVLPPSSSPRFGINKAVTIAANGTLRAAGRSLEEDTTLQQSDLAFRFSVGRELHKESTWLPLAARQRYTNELSVILAARLDKVHAAQAAEAAAERQRDEEAMEGMDHAAAAAEAQKVRYLSRVTFFFGYRKGDLQKMTSFSVKAHYSPDVKPSVDLHFIWSEHRPYNPNRAVTLCSAVAVFVSMITVLAVLRPSSRSTLLFSQRIVAVRAHD
ncbi:hypothetical protein GH5_05711 [Leishmania sp. Ghana 2012 LV757]|uniref:hypothetical protein n=1 Tax=Leishmania sp. Ghana 2012 LV757 TaxID=2803181 RepID=UPI001B525598|nr:hypothetical protein GH5_05711 [Leishmania sp. Ghana 2012 LV757]